MYIRFIENNMKIILITSFNVYSNNMFFCVKFQIYLEAVNKILDFRWDRECISFTVVFTLDF